MNSQSAIFSKVGVVGAGQMGAGIAQVFACAGSKVILTDANDAALEKARSTIQKSIEKLIQKNVIEKQAGIHASENIQYARTMDGMKDCDFAIEAVIEDEKIKTDVLQKLDQTIPSSAILATNTSSIPITRLASRTKRPQQFVGMHFMNPVPLMKLVEVISGMATGEDTLNRVIAAAEAMQKVTVKSHDFPGFIVNRILMPMINEAFRALMEGVASAKDIDAAMKLGCNQPMGPLTLADFIGLDTCLAIMNVLYTGLGDPRYAPCPLLRNYVEAGYLGVKTKRGVYSYE